MQSVHGRIYSKTFWGVSNVRDFESLANCHAYESAISREERSVMIRGFPADISEMIVRNVITTALAAGHVRHCDTDKPIVSLAINSASRFVFVELCCAGLAASLSKPGMLLHNGASLAVSVARKAATQSSSVSQSNIYTTSGLDNEVTISGSYQQSPIFRDILCFIEKYRYTSRALRLFSQQQGPISAYRVQFSADYLKGVTVATALCNFEMTSYLNFLIEATRTLRDAVGDEGFVSLLFDSQTVLWYGGAILAVPSSLGNAVPTIDAVYGTTIAEVSTDLLINSTSIFSAISAIAQTSPTDMSFGDTCLCLMNVLTDREYRSRDALKVAVADLWGVLEGFLLDNNIDNRVTEISVANTDELIRDLDFVDSRSEAVACFCGQSFGRCSHSFEGLLLIHMQSQTRIGALREFLDGSWYSGRRIYAVLIDMTARPAEQSDDSVNIA